MSADLHLSWLLPVWTSIPRDVPRSAASAYIMSTVLADGDGFIRDPTPLNRVPLVFLKDCLRLDSLRHTIEVVAECERWGLLRRVHERPNLPPDVFVVMKRPGACINCGKPAQHLGGAQKDYCPTCNATVGRRSWSWRSEALTAFEHGRGQGLTEGQILTKMCAATRRPMYANPHAETDDEAQAIVPWAVSQRLVSEHWLEWVAPNGGGKFSTARARRALSGEGDD